MVTKVTSIRMPLELNSDIKELATHSTRSENEQMVWMLEQQVRREKGIASMNRPCIISMGLPISWEDEEVKAVLDRLHTMFGWVEMERRERQGAMEFLCAAPKELSYDEAFILLQRRYVLVGWVYASSVPSLPGDVLTAQ